MTTREAHGQPQVTGERTGTSASGVVGATVVGSLLGGIAGGLVLSAVTTFHLPFVASLAGVGGGTAALGVWMGVALALGLGFGSIAEPAVGYAATATNWLTARIAPLRTLVERVPAGPTAGVGLLYGVLAGVGVGIVAVPLAVGGNVPPLESGPILAGYAVFGLVLGLGYEQTRTGTIPVPSLSFVSPTVRGAVLAPVVAGALSGAVVYAGEPVYLRYLSAVVGYVSPAVGFGLWMALSLVLGVVFAAVAARHAARGNSTTGYGFVYGVVLAVFVGLLGIPALVTATTRWPLNFEDVGVAVLGGFVVYGVVAGSLFGKTVNRRQLRPTFLVGRTRAVVLTAIVSGGLTAGLLYSVAPVALLMVGFLPGPGTIAAGVATWIGIAVLLGLGFATLPARRIERKDYPGQTGAKLGLGYGLLVALPVGALVVPRAVESVTFGLSMAPLTQGSVLGAYVLLGLLQGVTYGVVRGSGTVTPRFLEGRGLPVLGGVLVGGGAGAAVAYLGSVVPGYYLQLLGSVVGVGSITGGLAVWFGLALLLGLLFVPLGARTVEVDVGLVRGLGVGLVYGVVVAGIVGVLVAPSAIGLPVPYTNPPAAAYVVFGLLFGGVYGVLRKRTLAGESRPTSTAVGTQGQRAVVFGSLFGGSVGGLVVHHMVGGSAMLYFSSLVGYGSVTVGWGVWLALCLLLGAAFAVAVGPRLSRYARSMDEFADRDEDLDALFGDFFDGAPVTSAATVSGFAYGLVLAVVVGAVAFPMAINTMTPWGLVVPTAQPFFLLGFVVYGLVMGLGYGVVREF